VARLAPTPDLLKPFFDALSDAGVDIFHCSQRRFFEEPNSLLFAAENLAGWTRKITGKPCITCR